MARKGGKVELTNLVDDAHALEHFSEHNLKTNEYEF
jgi:hypothetical protein